MPNPVETDDLITIDESFDTPITYMIQRELHDPFDGPEEK